MQNGESLHQIEVLDQYLDGQLDAEAAQQLEQQLTQDKSLREQLDALIMSRDAIRSHALRQRMQQLHRDNIAQVREGGQVIDVSQRTSSSRSIYVWPLRVAAALLIGILGYGAIQYATLSPRAVYEEQYLSYRLPISRSTEFQMTPLDSLYQQHNYQAVIQLFEDQTETSRRDTFLAGLAYLETDNYARAIANFTQLQSTAGSDAATFQHETDYYLALTYLQNGQTEPALTLFEKIRSQEDHLYRNNISTTDLWKLRLLNSKQ